MTGKEFTKKAKELGAKVRKIDSAYWGKVWYEAIFENKVVSIYIEFEESLQAKSCMALSKNDTTVTADDLTQSAILQTKIALFIYEINQKED